MSFDDYCFEDPIESYERSLEEMVDIYGYNNYSLPPQPKQIKRICTKCEHKFKSAFPKACTECGGWTQTRKEFKKQKFDSFNGFIGVK